MIIKNELQEKVNDGRNSLWEKRAILPWESLLSSLKDRRRFEACRMILVYRVRWEDPCTTPSAEMDLMRAFLFLGEDEGIREQV